MIENCTVTGGLGGAGAAGSRVPGIIIPGRTSTGPGGQYYHKLLHTATLKNTNDGQAGGNGGMGSGNGYGGAIAMQGVCSPEIDNCRFINNSAQGAQGGTAAPAATRAYAPYYTSGSKAEAETPGTVTATASAEQFMPRPYLSPFLTIVYSRTMLPKRVREAMPADAVKET